MDRNWSGRAGVDARQEYQNIPKRLCEAGVLWEGQFFNFVSYAKVAREYANAIFKDGADIAIRSYDFGNSGSVEDIDPKKSELFHSLLQRNTSIEQPQNS